MHFLSSAPSWFDPATEEVRFISVSLGFITPTWVVVRNLIWLSILPQRHQIWLWRPKFWLFHMNLWTSGSEFEINLPGNPHRASRARISVLTKPWLPLTPVSKQASQNVLLHLVCDHVIDLEPAELIMRFGMLTNNSHWVYDSKLYLIRKVILSTATRKEGHSFWMMSHDQSLGEYLRFKTWLNIHNLTCNGYKDGRINDQLYQTSWGVQTWLRLIKSALVSDLLGTEPFKNMESISRKRQGSKGLTASWSFQSLSRPNRRSVGVWFSCQISYLELKTWPTLWNLTSNSLSFWE